MCSIIGSSSIKSINALSKLNAHRGALSHSIAAFNHTGCLLNLTRQLGPMPEIVSEVVDAVYYVCHQQAPTTQELDTIHPSAYQGNLLWHNGIVKNHYLKRMIATSGDASEWDTHQLNRALTVDGISSLDPVEGSFTCVWYNSSTKKLQMFRNAISPLFTNGADISSVKFDGSYEISDGVLYSLDFVNCKWVLSNDTFKNVETPFFYFD